MGVITLLAAVGWGRQADGADAPVRPPNVVLILADDLGWSDLGCYGADLHKTPHLDRLAREGVRFTRAFSMSVCTPTRAAILTGKHAARLHMTTWREAAVGLQTRTAPPSQRLLPPAPRMNLPRGELTLAEALRSVGYVTYHVGKWHLGDAEDYPEVHGFDVNVGGTLWGAPETYFHPFRGESRSPGEYRYVPGLGPGRHGDELTDRLTDEAIALIDRAGDRPFFLNLWHHAVHTPIEARKEVVDRYRSLLHPGLKHLNPNYAALVEALDRNVGRLLSHLDAKGLAGSTVVVFASDNGGYLGRAGGLPVTTNAPLRSGKGSLYEGGVRVPLIVRWPGVARAGATADEMVDCTDLWPTLAAAAGVAPDGVARDGLSLVPLLRDPGTRLNRDALFFHYPHYYPTTTPVSAVRGRRWKLLEYDEDRRVELYDLEADPGERNDLAAQQPERREALRRRLAEWRTALSVQEPEPNPGYRPGADRP